ncbi:MULTISPECIES: FAD-dependent oxidoreductase [Rhodococcus]|uniref:FAD-dependent oxidoreductase n=1 Tax=Rhodococcus globerulus TaxID=33008 RepID=UPI001C56ADE6|nr:FAD-dependent oxidoreductase [Rhodococcus globerulus]QXV99948.1 FAD-dependent oxidoreductase [Rhodococcus globerulus]
MTYVITQPCCNDASCVSVCPVNCIHPTPDEPEFLRTEMLFIDPATCIDCGACVEECPVEAILDDESLDEGQQRYLQINADYYTDHDVTAGLVVPGKNLPLIDGDQLNVAIVGAGPAAFYAAAELVKHPAVRVNMFDRLPTPYGLVRAGVAPDHPSTKQVEKTFASVASKKSFEYFLNVEVGRHVSADELRERYGAVIYAHGASADKRLGIVGEDRSGSIAATDFVAWYNGHPDYADRQFDLSGSRAVVVGNGNVALDVARILLTNPDLLGTTDIADHALEALRESQIQEVVIMARRGIAQAAYTVGEFLAMGDLPGVDVIIAPDELVLDPANAQARLDGTLDSTIATKLRIAEEFAARMPTPRAKRVVFRYLVSPVAIDGADDRTDAVRCVRNEFSEVSGSSASVAATGEEFDLPATLVMRAIGYTGLPLDGVPFDDVTGVVPNVEGRVVGTARGDVVPGVYVTGWIKRGATGGIGRNRMCGEETARAVVADLRAGALPEPSKSPADIVDLVSGRGANPVDGAGWKKIDAVERAAGTETGRRRVKLIRIDEMASVARG